MLPFFKKKIYFINLILLLCITKGCNNQPNKGETKTIDLGSFKLVTPINWKEYKLEGIDSYIGGITNGTDSIGFSHSYFIYFFQDLEYENYLFSIDTIEERTATMFKPKLKGEGKLGLYIYDTPNYRKLRLSCNNFKDERTVLEIFKSVTFEDSNLGKNKAVSFEKFSTKNYLPIPEIVFKNSCTESCHRYSYEKLSAPGMETITKERFEEYSLNLLEIDSTDEIHALHKSLFSDLPLEKKALLKSLCLGRK